MEVHVGLSTAEIVAQGLEQLQPAVIERKSVIEPNVGSASDYQNFFLLTIYRNQLVHLFFNEGICCAIIYALAIKASGSHGTETEAANSIPSSVLVRDVREHFLFLHALFRIENVNDLTPAQREQCFEEVLHSMITRGTVSLQSARGETTISIMDERVAYFSAMIVWPLIDSYWMMSMSLSALYVPHYKLTEAALVERVQWMMDKFYREGLVEFFESSSKNTLQNAISIFVELDVVEAPRSSSGRKLKFKAPYDERQAALTELSERIGSFRRRPHRDLTEVLAAKMIHTVVAKL